MRAWGEGAGVQSGVFAILLFPWTLDLPRRLTPDRPDATLTPFGPAAPIVPIFLIAAAGVVSPNPSLSLSLTAGVLFGRSPGTLNWLLGGEVGAGATRRAQGEGR